MLNKIKHLLIGSPLPTHLASENKLNKIRALAAFSPDALSSIAYANQEIYLGLVVAGAVGLQLALPIGSAIVLLLLIVAISYLQTIQAYPSGGGSYVVARENLGTLPGLTAGSALMVGYLLTAAVSLTAGVEAIASVYPILWTHKSLLALLLLLLITLANLRGLRETGTLMSVPVYLFLITYIPMLGYGLWHLIDSTPISLDLVAPSPSQPVTIFLILHAFATGCTALTGIEVISNSVPYFYPPEIKNASKTLIVMTVLMVLLFAGSILLVQGLAIIAKPQETILSALSRRLLGTNPLYILIQISTLLILAVAANSSFAGFPRLAAILGGDGYLPRQFSQIGDRLVYNNGILLLSAATGLLIFIFKGDSHSLIPLFAIGVFLAFTLSQFGMVIHWLRNRHRGWLIKALTNGLGATVTGIALMIISYSNFMAGAWIVFLIIPVVVLIFMQIKSHYQLVGKQLSLRGLPPSLKPFPAPRVVIPVSGVHRGMVDAVDFARSITKEVTGLYIELEPGNGKKILSEWERWFPDIPLVVKASPYRSIIRPLIDFLDETDALHNDGQQAVVVLPEFIPAKWWHGLLHNQSSWLIKTALLYRRRNLGYQRVIIDVPYHLRK